jgi:hypothetical protein
MSQDSARVGKPRRYVFFAAIVILCGAVLSGFVLQRDDVEDPAPLRSTRRRSSRAATWH